MRKKIGIILYIVHALVILLDIIRLVLLHFYGER